MRGRNLRYYCCPARLLMTARLEVCRSERGRGVADGGRKNLVRMRMDGGEVGREGGLQLEFSMIAIGCPWVVFVKGDFEVRECLLCWGHQGDEERDGWPRELVIVCHTEWCSCLWFSREFLSFMSGRLVAGVRRCARILLVHLSGGAASSWLVAFIYWPCRCCASPSRAERSRDMVRKQAKLPGKASSARCNSHIRFASGSWGGSHKGR